jgi:hypothetical protein
VLDGRNGVVRARSLSVLGTHFFKRIILAWVGTNGFHLRRHKRSKVSGPHAWKGVQRDGRGRNEERRKRETSVVIPGLQGKEDVSLGQEDLLRQPRSRSLGKGTCGQRLIFKLSERCNANLAIPSVPGLHVP